MDIRNFAKYSLAALVAVACTVQDPVQEQAPIPSGPVSSCGVATVQFDDQLTALVEEALAQGTVQTKSARLDAVLEDLGVESLERVFPYAGEFEERTRKEGLHRFYHVQFRADIPETKATEDLTAVPGVLYARTTHRISLRTTFNDPYFFKQWHYVSTNGADINVQKVWNTYTKGSSSVVVCVVDEPVDPTHEDLKANLWKDADGHTGYNFARDNHDLSIRPEFGEGDEGHGTHVAGIVGAVNNNGKGVCGIAGGDFAAGAPGVRIQSCAIFSGQSSANDRQTANAIKWGADHGAVISQNSWGYSADGFLDGEPDGELTPRELEEYQKCTINSVPDIKAAIDYFIKYAGCDNQGNQLPDSPMKGGLVFFAAGNEDIDHDIIGRYEPVIAVGATNVSNQKASYSNYGSWVDVAAPGGNGSTERNSIWSTVPRKSDISETGYDGVGWAGTSMACPHVTGVAALGIAYALKLGKHYTVDEFNSMIVSSAKDIDARISSAGSKTVVRADGSVYSTLKLSDYYHNMGSGCIDAWSLMMKIEGVPCSLIATGSTQWVDLSPYFGTASTSLTYTGFEMSKEAREALGVVGEPELKHGRLYINASKIGSAKVTINAIGGGTAAGTDTTIGGMAISREISIITRGFTSATGGWL